MSRRRPAAKNAITCSHENCEHLMAFERRAHKDDEEDFSVRCRCGISKILKACYLKSHTCDGCGRCRWLVVFLLL